MTAASPFTLPDGSTVYLVKPSNVHKFVRMSRDPRVDDRPSSEDSPRFPFRVVWDKSYDPIDSVLARAPFEHEWFHSCLDLDGGKVGDSGSLEDALAYLDSKATPRLLPYPTSTVVYLATTGDGVVRLSRDPRVDGRPSQSNRTPFPFRVVWDAVKPLPPFTLPGVDGRNYREQPLDLATFDFASRTWAYSCLSLPAREQGFDKGLDNVGNGSLEHALAWLDKK